MTTVQSSPVQSSPVRHARHRAAECGDPCHEAEIAAAAFLARYSGRTLETYLEEKGGLAPATIDRRLGAAHEAAVSTSNLVLWYASIP